MMFFNKYSHTGSLKDFVYHKKPTILLVSREEISNARTAASVIKVTQAAVAVLINTWKLMAITLSTCGKWRGKRELVLISWCLNKFSIKIVTKVLFSRSMDTYFWQTVCIHISTLIIHVNTYGSGFHNYNKNPQQNTVIIVIRKIRRNKINIMRHFQFENIILRWTFNKD